MANKKVKNLKIVSNGDASGTFLYVDGKYLDCVEEIKIDPIRPGMAVTAKIKLSYVELEIKAVGIIKGKD